MTLPTASHDAVVIKSLEPCFERDVRPSQSEARAPRHAVGVAGVCGCGELSRSFDGSELLLRVGGDNRLLSEIVLLFEDQRGSLFEVIRRACSEGDTRAVERGAHKLRGALLNLSAAPAAELALMIEECGRQGKAATPEQLDALSTELARLSVALAAFEPPVLTQ